MFEIHKRISGYICPKCNRITRYQDGCKCEHCGWQTDIEASMKNGWNPLKRGMYIGDLYTVMHEASAGSQITNPYFAITFIKDLPEEYWGKVLELSLRQELCKLGVISEMNAGAGEYTCPACCEVVPITDMGISICHQCGWATKIGLSLENGWDPMGNSPHLGDHFTIMHEIVPGEPFCMDMYLYKALKELPRKHWGKIMNIDLEQELIDKGIIERLE